MYTIYLAFVDGRSTRATRSAAFGQICLAAELYLARGKRNAQIRLEEIDGF